MARLTVRFSSKYTVVPDERLGGPHALADVLAAPGFVPSGRGVELKAGGDVRPLGVPAQIEGPHQQVGEAGVHGLADRERRGRQRGVRQGSTTIAP